ncbi:MAG: hypothetical protein DSY76_02740 [Bacteroidetes bacterium]|nr:MAG: hypothetical protein DSY76_02740 [Bacteroidota bacterium]
MKQISIIAAKGGVGKTMLTAAFASLAKNLVLVDCDTESRDLSVFLNAEYKEEQKVDTIQRVAIAEDECIRCGLCKAMCHFDAVINPYGVYQIKEEHCQACDLCLNACPVSAIDHVKSEQNKWGVAATRFGDVYNAQLALGEDLNGKLISIIREKAQEQALAEAKDLVLIDGPPAVGFAIASTIAGVDVAVLVLEPTPSAISDLQKSKQLTERYEVPMVCLLNKSDLNPEMALQVKEYCGENEIPLIGEILFDSLFIESQMVGQTVVEFAPDSETTNLLKKSFEAIL